MPKKTFKKPGQKVVNGDMRDIPDVTGLGPTQAEEQLKKAGFKAKVGSQVNSGVQAGAVAYTQPRGKALKGATVTMYISNGTPPYTPPPAPSTTQAPPAPSTTQRPSSSSSSSSSAPTSTSKTSSKTKNRPSPSSSRPKRTASPDED